jgi:hypothetical protein
MSPRYGGSPASPGICPRALCDELPGRRGFHFAGYQPYEATRAFWERRGFVQVDTINPLPGWEPGNPAAIYTAALRPTR